MDQGPHERFSRQDLLYRLALVLEVSWQTFQHLELWEIRNRAFVEGESVVERKIERLDAQVTAEAVKNSDEPGKAQKEYEQYYRKAIEVEAEETSQQAEKRKMQHNQSFFDELRREMGSEK